MSSLLLSISISVDPHAYSLAATKTVEAADYREYWLWAGVRRRPEIDRAKTIYLLQGEVALKEPDDFVVVKPQGGVQPAPHPQDLWIVYRVRTLEWSSSVFASLIRKYENWRAVPGKIHGVQIDFDAGTKNLANYVSFLKSLRLKLPSDCKLSVTGLMDWAANASVDELNELSRTVDEIIFQTYKKDKTVDDIDKYLNKIGRIQIPFKLGIGEGALWDPPQSISHNKYFRGYVVFLRNNVPTQKPAGHIGFD